MSQQQRTPEQILSALKRTLDEAEWEWLKPHHERGGLLILAHGLDLLDVAFRIAMDDKTAVATWLDSGELKRPTSEQAELWDKTPARKFMTVVVQPYVLAQEQLLH